MALSLARGSSFSALLNITLSLAEFSSGGGIDLVTDAMFGPGRRLNIASVTKSIVTDAMFGPGRRLNGARSVRADVITTEELGRNTDAMRLFGSFRAGEAS